MRALDLSFLIRDPPQQLDEPEKAIVLLLRRPLGGLVDELQVEALVRSQLPDLDRCQRSIEARGVIGTALPRVIDGHETRALGIPVRQQIAVPGEKPGIESLHQRASVVSRYFCTHLVGSLPDAQSRYRVDSRLAEAAGLARRVGGIQGRDRWRPVLRSEQVATRRSVGV